MTTLLRLLRAHACFLTVPILLTACATLGIGHADQATRILADIRCITVASAAGLQVAGDPVVNGAKTALDVLAAITAVGTSNVPSTVYEACKDTLAYAAEDAKGALALVTGTTGSASSTVPPPTPQARRAAPPQPSTPQPVIIPIPKKK